MSKMYRMIVNQCPYPLTENERAILLNNGLFDNAELDVKGISFIGFDIEYYVHVVPNVFGDSFIVIKVKERQDTNRMKSRIFDEIITL